MPTHGDAKGSAQALVDVERDRDEWRTQHENLLVMYRAAEDKAAWRAEALRDSGARCVYLETMLRRVLFNFPMWQEPEEQLLAAIRTALAAGQPAGDAKGTK